MKGGWNRGGGEGKKGMLAEAPGVLLNGQQVDRFPASPPWRWRRLTPPVLQGQKFDQHDLRHVCCSSAVRFNFKRGRFRSLRHPQTRLFLFRTCSHPPVLLLVRLLRQTSGLYFPNFLSPVLSLRLAEPRRDHAAAGAAVRLRRSPG